jgi:hypothetical protein
MNWVTISPRTTATAGPSAGATGRRSPNPDPVSGSATKPAPSLREPRSADQSKRDSRSRRIAHRVSL